MKSLNKGFAKKTLIILLVIILIVGGCVFFLLKENKSYDKAEKILYSTFDDFSNFSVETFNSEEFKTYISVKNTIPKNMEYTCKELFGNNLEPWLGITDGKSWSVEFNDNKMSLLCYDSESNDYYSYDEVNEKYKSMFGENKDALKQNVSYGKSNFFGYSDSKNVYTSLSCECGSDGTTAVYGIVDYEETNEKVYIDFVIGKVDQESGESNIIVFKDGTKKKMTDSDLENKNTYQKYAENLDKYEFVFTKYGNYYIFDSVNEVK